MLDSLSQVARQYGFGVNLLSKWRSEFFQDGHTCFEAKPDQNLVKLQQKINKLEQIIGKKEVELNLIKNLSKLKLTITITNCS
ncbi:hypothetical protein AUJ59_03695 [Candidatus Beckwithbacteria bacterium CG1_02_47_37]|uniref:Transposase n=1 Tax=Candidatus Beckwithbacteria bacterium CG1_02_47_37 TaxID=1805034 RepID=A0A1J4RME7_9BACT|nr:MAG: hypothetical protein AUJ59_03695 [Candidatus Beckwithbacteria bacterium CG1_02_47_37]